MMSNKNPKDGQNQDATKSEVKGFDIQINEFGEVVCSHDMDNINDFLDKNVPDKKLPDAPASQGK